MHSCATSQIRESRPEYHGCVRSCKCFDSTSGIIRENENLTNHHGQPKRRARRSHNSRLSTSKACYYCDIHVNLNPEKIESVLHPLPHPPFIFGRAECLGAENVKLLCHVPSYTESGHWDEWQAERQNRPEKEKRRGWPCLVHTAC